MDDVIINDLLPEYKCPLCLGMLNQPVVLTTCRQYVCAGCCVQWLRSSQSLSCPCCYSDHFTEYSSTIRSAPELVLMVLSKLVVTCRLCEKNGLLKDHQAHLKSKCKSHFSDPVTVTDVLKKSQTSPLSHIEEKLQSALVQRSMSTSPSPSSLQVKTKGQVNL